MIFFLLKKEKFEKNDIFPIKKRKFENIIINASNKPIKILNNEYPKWKEICKSGTWNHKYEKSKIEVTLPCKYIN